MCAICALQNVSARSAPADAQKTSSQIRVMLVDTTGTLYVQPQGQWQIRDANKAVRRLTPGTVAQLSLQDDWLALSTTASATTTSFGLAKGTPVVLEPVSAAAAETDRISIG